MSAPQFDIPQRDRRATWTWIALFVLFGFLIVSTLAESFGADGLTIQQRQHDQALRQAVSTRRILGQQAAADELLDDPISQLAVERRTDPDAAATYLVMRYEQGKKILPQDIEYLSDDDLLNEELKRQYRLVREVYGSDSLDKDRATQIAEALPTDRYVFERAAEHAKAKAGIREVLEKDSALKTFARLMAIVFGIAGGLGGVGLWIVYFVSRSQGRAKPQGFPTGILSLAESDRFAGRALQLVGLFLVAGIFAEVLGRTGDKRITGVIAMGAFLLLVVWLFSTRIFGRPLTLRRIGISGEHFGRHVLWGIGGFFANIPVLVALLGVMMPIMRYLPPPSHPASEEMQRTSDPVTILSLLFMAAIVAPIWEEICFRGVMTPAMARIFGGTTIGIFASSFLFASIHPQGPALWPMLGWIGAMGALLTYQTRSLVPAIVMHAVHNGVLLILSLVVT